MLQGNHAQFYLEPLLAPSHHDDTADVSESQIDPLLADHPGDVELQLEVDAGTGADADADAKPTPLRTKGKRTRIVPGSEADFRRKEANRLAAERSRIRAHEKAAGLEVAARSLEEENARLKAQLARLEAEVGGGGGVQSHETDGHATATATATLSGTGAGGIQSQSQSESESHSQPLHQTISVDDPSSDAATQAQNDVHSRNILAALMSDAGITGVEEGDEATWMQGVENFIKEAESSGRLGELAAVAAGQNDGEGEGNAGIEGEGGDAQGGVSENSAAEGDQSSSVPPEGQATPQLEADTSSTSKPRVLGFTLAGAAQATASAIAVALNTEMERILRDDLAATKAAIARLEREIAHVREGIPPAGGPPSGELDLPSEEPSHPPSLPADVLADDAETIRASSDTAQESIKRLEDELPELRNTVATMRDEKVQEETKMAEVVDELFVLGVDGGAEDTKRKEEVDNLLKAIGGYVGSLINGGQPNVSGFPHRSDSTLSL